MTSQDFMKDAIKHAEETFPKESCGVVIDGKYIPITNVAARPDEHFIMDTSEYTDSLLLGELNYIVHSHPNAPSRPSDADREGCEQTDAPWIIISVGDSGYHDHTEIVPCGWKAPLLGRSFTHGVHDCLTIILDYYWREKGIDLGSYDREDGWWDNGKDYYNELLPKAGFVPVDTLQDGDVVLMQIRSPVPNHAGIYLEDGVLESEMCHPAPNTILHHMYNRESTREIYGGYWLEKTVSVWRYTGESNG